MVIESPHYKFVKQQTSPFKLIVINDDHVKGNHLAISEIDSLTGKLTGFWSEYEILKSDLIEHNTTMPSYLWLTVSPLACHSPQKSEI